MERTRHIHGTVSRFIIHIHHAPPTNNHQHRRFMSTMWALSMFVLLLLLLLLLLPPRLHTHCKHCVSQATTPLDRPRSISYLSTLLCSISDTCIANTLF